MKAMHGKGLRAAGLLGAAFLCAAAVPAGAQLFITDPQFQKGPIEGSDPLVGLPLPGATPAEYRAHLLWNLRSGLNVAALSCQFSPYLRTVPNYNDILAHHSRELAAAYTALNGYFKRVHGAKQGMIKFDDYSTVTYNNFSPRYAQNGFCQVAADVAKEALLRPKGQFYTVAQNRMRELRSSLVPAYDRIAIYNPYTIQPPVLPPLDPACYDRKDRLRKKCATAVYAAR
jgi:hypothetical protein